MSTFTNLRFLLSQCQRSCIACVRRMHRRTATVLAPAGAEAVAATARGAATAPVTAAAHPGRAAARARAAAPAPAPAAAAPPRAARAAARRAVPRRAAPRPAAAAGACFVSHFKACLRPAPCLRVKRLTHILPLMLAGLHPRPGLDHLAARAPRHHPRGRPSDPPRLPPPGAAPQQRVASVAPPGQSHICHPLIIALMLGHPLASAIARAC